MPQIYERPPTFTAVDSQIANRGTGVTGSLSNIFDMNPYTFYDTKADGTQNADGAFELNFRLNLNPVQDVDTIYVIADGVETASFALLTPSGPRILDNVSMTTTYNNRKAAINTLGASYPITQGSLTLTRTPTANIVRIYQVLIMRRLEDLKQINSSTINRAITRFETSRASRNSYIIEALDGTRSLQTGSVSKSKRMVNYTIWESRAGTGSNIRTVRNNLNKFYDTVRQYPNFIIWDLSEPAAEDYEAVFPAYWIPNSFQDRIEGVNAISYSFTVEEQ